MALFSIVLGNAQNIYFYGHHLEADGNILKCLLRYYIGL